MKNILNYSTFLNTFKLFILFLCFSSDAFGLMNKIEKTQLSLDEITFLLCCPRLASDIDQYLTDDIDNRLNNKISLQDRGRLLSDIILHNSEGLLDPKVQCDLGATDNFYHHFRLKGGIDLQFCSRRKIKRTAGREE